MHTSDCRLQDFYVGVWRVEPSLNRLTNADDAISIQPRLMEVLVCLARHAGEIVTYDQLLEEVWRDFDVRDNVLHRTISKLRKALRQSTSGGPFIKTIPKKGYCLIAPVRFGALVEEAPMLAPPDAASGDGLAAFSVGTPLPPPRPPAPPKARKPLRWIVSLLAVVTALFGASRFLPPTASLPEMRLFTSQPGVEIHPAFSPDGTQIAFVSITQERGADLYVQGLDDEVPRRLTEPPRHEYAPAWSPDGRRLAYYSFDPDDLADCGIYILPVAGGSAHKVADCDKARQRQLAWSPDGQWLALEVLHVPTDAWRLHLLSLETGAMHPATVPTSDEAQDQNFAFSADGMQLLFYRFDPTSASGPGDFYMAPVSETPTIPQRLTHNIGFVSDFDWAREDEQMVFFSPRQQTRALWRMRIDAAPELLQTIPEIIGKVAVSPQGTHVAYVSWNYQENIWRVPLQQDAATPPQPRPFIQSTRRDMFPRIDPSGERVVFASNRTGFGELWISDYEGEHQVRLTDLRAVASAPRWSPDGRLIAFHAAQDGQRDVFVIEADGGEPQPVTVHPSDDTLPSWSRDGRTLYFASARSGVYEVWKIPVEGGEAVQVTRGGGFTSWEAWDGRALFFSKSAQPGIWKLNYADGGVTLITETLDIADYDSWAVTPTALYLPKRDRGKTLLLRHDLASGEESPVMTLHRNILHGGLGLGLAVSPDERWLLFGRVDERTSDIMLIETPQ